ncbi:DNA internalization-related competence protein ComEC/Rec2 [Oenococcus alcoholitolerans]|uniref:DNA internalization-related competence protein ComEC/Rec2 n=1 Tax=Oenococcus alcoholitolerans TaxID=931074 RepID=UPI003F6E9538
MGFLKGDIGNISEPTNFNQFNIRKYYKSQKISNQINNVSLMQVSKYKTGLSFQTIFNLLHTFRKKVIVFFDKMPAPLSDYSKSLLIGELEKDFYDRYPGLTELGLIHLFSISGFQLSSFFKILRKLFMMLRLTKETSLIVIALLMPLFFVFAGSAQSLLRPLIAIEISIFCFFKNIKISKVTIWSMSLMIGIFLSPMILNNLSGQLSYLLSFCLIFASKLNKFKLGLLMSFISMPLILNTKFSWHLLSAPANFIAIPLFGKIIIPIVILASLFCFFNINFLLMLLNQSIKIFAFIFESIAELPGKINFGSLPNYMIIPIIIFIFFVFDENKKIAFWGKAGVFSSLLFSFILIRFPFQGELSFFDIGQGDSIFFRSPLNKQTIMIDTGGKINFSKTESWQKRKSSFNQVKSISGNYLKSLGIFSLDYLILTHGDLDHIGNAKYLFPEILVKNLLIPSGMIGTRSFKKEIEPFLNEKTKVIQVTDRTSLREFNFKILHPFNTGQAKNEDSIVTYGQAGPIKFISTGDLDKNGEQKVKKRYPGLTADLIKLGHHGSNTSSDEDTLKAWKINIGVISAGRSNRYGHPKQEVLQTVRKLKIKTFNTQVHGMIRFRYTSKRGIFETFIHSDDTN